jgi:hypothetical protein
MNSRGVLFTLLVFVGALLAPARAQLIHLSIETEGSLIFHSPVAGNEYDHATGLITKLDVYYDSQVPLGAWRDPSRNFWKMRVDVPEAGSSFVFARSFDQIYVGEDKMGISFEYFRSMPYEEFSFSLIFATPFTASDAGFPLPPLPALGSTEWVASSYKVMGTRSWFPDPGVAEAYGLGGISSVTATFIPVPEPSTYAVGALLMVAVVIGVRRRSLRRSAGIAVNA